MVTTLSINNPYYDSTSVTSVEFLVRHGMVIAFPSNNHIFPARSVSPVSSSLDTEWSLVFPSTTVPVASVPFSFTSTFTDGQGNPVTTVVQGTFTQSTPLVQPSSVTQAPPGTESAPGLSQTQPVPVQSFSFTSVFTDDQGKPVTTVIQVSQTSQIVQPIPGPSQSFPGLQTVTLVLTDAQGNPTSTVIQLSQPIQSQPVQSTQPSSEPIQTVTLVLTDPQGNPTSTVTQLSQPSFLTQASPTQASPNPTFTAGPSITPPPGTTGTPPPCQPYPECLISVPTSTEGGPVCSPLPGCIFPTVTGKPTSCSPFPSCLSTVIPQTVQNELSSICDGITLIDCIFTKPNPTCTAFPECLLDGVDPDICPGYPFPDCLFTLYEPKVTSVMTTLPPGVTIRTSSNDDYKSNTWSSSTNSDGHLIFFPIIVGCPGCTSLLTIIDNIDGFFNTIFKFPPIPFPKFPKIPELHFPCIFFCKKGHKHNKPKPPVYDEPNKPNEENESQTSTATSSSQSSCEAATASACTVLSTVKVDGTKTTTMTSTTCSAETKCSATGHSTTTATTSTATPTLAYYFIVPDKTKDISVINAFTVKLKVETEEKTLFHSGTSEYTSFWGQYLSETPAEAYAKEPAVRRVFPEGEFDNVLVHAHRAYNQVVDDHPASIWNETDLWQNKIGKRAPIVNQQRTTEDSLKVISQPPGIPLDTIDTYAFNRETPRSARIYMVDSGFAVSHASYTWIKNNIETPEWIWPGSPGAENHRYPYDYVYPDTFTDSDTWRNHGTGMAGRAVGAAYGVSKFAQLTVVRLPQGIPTNEEIAQLKLPTASFERSVSRNSVMTDAFRHILDDVRAKGLQKKAVINISRGIISKATTLPMLESSLYEMFDLLRQLASQGVVIVVASGNVEDDDSKVMTNAFVHWSTAIPIIVVGSVYNSGTVWEYTKDVPANGFPGSTVHVWAPGVDMYFSTTVAFNTQRQKNSGTSGSTAMVSGLISYFLGVDSHREKIQQIANGFPDSNGYGWSEAIKKYLQDTSSVAAPTVTDTFSGYIGSNCLQGNVAPMVHEDATKVAAQLCGRSYTWDAKNKPPRDTKDTSVATVEASLVVNGIKTLGQIKPTEGVASACASGTYPRTLTADECQKAYTRLFSECPTGGQLSWVTEDHHGCMNFFMNQGPANPPPEVTNPPPPPPPEPSTPPTPPTTINNEKCFKSDEFDDELAILPGLAATAITSFCSRSYTWQHFDDPADGETGPDVHVIRKTPSGLSVVELRAVTAPFVEGLSDEACRVNKYPRTLDPEICTYAFNHLKDSTCTYGGQNIATSVAGCYAFTLMQTQNFDG